MPSHVRTLARQDAHRGLTPAGLLLSIAALLAAGPGAAHGETTRATTRPSAGFVTAQGLQDNRIQLLTGRSTVLTTQRPCKRVSIADPEIALARPVGVTSILLVPKKAGATQLILWDENERAQMIDVLIQADLQLLREQLRTLFPTERIEAASVNGSVALHGRVHSALAAQQAVQVASPYGNVLNLLEVAGGRQVALHVRFAEVSRSASTALGVNFGYNDGRSFAASNVGQVNPLGIRELKSEATSLGVGTPSPAVTLFGRAALGDTSLDYFVNALRQHNLLRILAEPNLMATSGEKATFLAGGKFPVPITQGGAGAGAGGVAITVEYRDFGVKLNFTPVVLGDGRIRLTVNPEVSDLDFTTAVRFNGFVVPGLSTREVSTTIELAENQTFAIAGLLNHNVTANRDVTPVLGDVPVLGALFRSVRYQRRETELVVLVTPRLVGAMDPGEVPAAPGEAWRHPSEKDLFLKADLGGPAGARAAGPPPSFYGQAGFVAVPEPAKEKP